LATAPLLSRKEFAAMLRRQILPRVENGMVTLVPAHPLLASHVARVRPQAAPLLRSIRHGREALMAAHWTEEGFNAARYPTLIWVASGEADFWLGVTRRMAAHDKALPAKHGSYVVALPAHSFFLVPPGTPFSDSSRPHWERPHPQDARSHLLWFNILPAGVSLHACSTKGREHTPTLGLFLSETRLLPLAEAILDEARAQSTHNVELIRHHLAALLLYIDRSLTISHPPLEEEGLIPSRQQGDVADGTPVQLACRYIETHLDKKLLLRQIAGAAYVSPSHLNSLFRAVQGQSVGEYITHRRMEQARSLLETTALPINRVGVLCGYLHAEQFSRAFARHHAVSPGDFRRRVQSK
jgi:AraC-like DNA-binding protein